DFKLEWQPFVEGTAADFIQVRVLDDSFGESFPVFETAALGETGALTGTEKSVIIPGGFLEIGKTYKGLLTFAKVVSTDTTAYPGAVGTVAFAKETQFTIKTTSSGGVPSSPTVLFANPTDGATD